MIAPQPRVRPRLIAIDLDGTLIDRTLIIAEPVKEAIAAAREAGVTVMIVTGRMYAASRRFADELGLSGPVICYQGAAVYDLDTGKRIRHTPLPTPVALDLLRKAKRDDLDALCYFDDTLHVEEVNACTKIYTDVARVEPVVVPSLEAELERGRETTKFVVVMDRAKADTYTTEMTAFAGDRAYVTRSNPEFVEAVDPHVNKGEALRFVTAHLGIPLEETMAIGDAWNDVPMVSIAGIGVAMGSAPPELVAEADVVVGDVAHYGVAEAIRRYVLA